MDCRTRHALQVLVLLGVSVVVLTLLARKIRVAPPIVLLLGGVALAFVPWLAGVRLPPEVVLLIFLPALLYWESLNTSLREIRANLRAVMLDSILLVLATAAAVAAVGHALGLSWPVGLGARRGRRAHRRDGRGRGGPPDAAPPDHHAARGEPDQRRHRAGGLRDRGRGGHRQGHFGWPGAIGSFALSYVGGAAVGLLVAWLTARCPQDRLHDPLLENTVNVLAPFIAFLLAEEIHASGVLAVVVAGWR